MSGAKRWEYRRTPPARTPPYRLFLYASTPVQAVIGVAHSARKIEGEPSDVVTDTVGDTPHEPASVLEYLDGVDACAAIRIERKSRFETAIPRDYLEAIGCEPSQNFRYLSPDQAEEILHEGN